MSVFAGPFAIAGCLLAIAGVAKATQPAATAGALAALRSATTLPAIEADAARLGRVVRFHIVADVVDIGSLAAQGRGASTSATTLEGHSITVTIGAHLARVEGVTVDPQRIVAGNGSVYTIAGLLEPPA